MNPSLTRTQNRPSAGMTDVVHINGLATTLSIVIVLAAVIGAAFMDTAGVPDGWIAVFAIGLALIAVYLLFALKIARQWEKAVVLRFGKIHKLAGPGLFWIIPIIDTLANWIDHRVMVTPFSAEKTLTKDAT